MDPKIKTKIICIPQESNPGPSDWKASTSTTRLYIRRRNNYVLYLKSHDLGFLKHFLIQKIQFSSTFHYRFINKNKKFQKNKSRNTSNYLFFVFLEKISLIGKKLNSESSVAQIQ